VINKSDYFSPYSAIKLILMTSLIASIGVRS